MFNVSSRPAKLTVYERKLQNRPHFILARNDTGVINRLLTDQFIEAIHFTQLTIIFQQTLTQTNSRRKHVLRNNNRLYDVLNCFIIYSTRVSLLK